MKRWNYRKGKEISNVKIDVFLREVIEVSKKHGMSISHEDTHGAFVVEQFCEKNAEWLSKACDGT